MITKKIIAPLFVVILLAGIGGVFTAQQSTKQQTKKTSAVSNMQESEPENATEPATSSEQEATETSSTATTQTTQPAQSTVKAGRYTQYSSAAVSSGEYKNTVLFFHAGWCPECRAFDKAIKESTVPAGTQILKVDYDSSTDLRKKYGVTLQSTFVSVSSNGDQRAKWVGYGKNKSAQTVLENLNI
jgi:cytoskeletal protein RodZ